MKLDDRKTKKFKVEDFFYVETTKAYKLTNNKLYEDDGKNPVIVNSYYNNGVGGYSNLETTEKGNVITFSDTTSAKTIFYQPNDFIGYSHVQKLRVKEEFKDNFNKWCMLFFMNVFKASALAHNYDYVTKFPQETAKRLEVELPIDKNDCIDWQFMEDYMKNIFSICENRLKSFLD